MSDVKTGVELIAAERKSGNGTTDKPIVVTLAKLRDLAKATKDAEKNAETMLGDKVKDKWGLTKESVVKFEGKTSAKREGTKTTLTFPNKEAVNGPGDAVSVEAKKLQETLAAMKDMQEVEIAGTNWEMKKAGAGVGVILPANLDSSLFAQINAIANIFASQTRVNEFRVNKAELPADDTPAVKYVAVSGLGILYWNDRGRHEDIIRFFNENKKDLDAANSGTLWKFEGNQWKVSIPKSTP